MKIFRAISGFLGFKLKAEELNQIAYAIEKKQHGTPSGIDNTVVCYQKPIVADKKYILAKAARFGPKLPDALYCRVMEDFCARKSDYLQPKWLEIYHNLLEERNYNCLSKTCSDLAYYPPPFIKKSKSKGHS